MLKITEFVPASKIWPTADDHTDIGEIPGLMRGYNVEIKVEKTGVVDWLSAIWIQGEPEKEFNDDFHTWMYAEHGWTPTGRICFRGYGTEEYDQEERDVVINIISDEKASELANMIAR